MSQSRDCTWVNFNDCFFRWRSKQPERSSPDATSSGESSAAATDEEEADENTDEEFSSTNDLSTLHESVYKNLSECRLFAVYFHGNIDKVCDFATFYDFV